MLSKTRESMLIFLSNNYNEHRGIVRFNSKNLDLYKVIGNCNFYNYCHRNFCSKYDINILKIYYIFLLILMYVFSVKREGTYTLLMTFYAFVSVNKTLTFSKKYKTFLVRISLEETPSYTITKYLILSGKLF